MSDSLATDPEIVRLQDDINFHQTMANSLAEQDHGGESRREHLQKLSRLKKQLMERKNAMSSSHSLSSLHPNEAGDRPSSSGSSTHSDRSSQSSAPMVPPTIDLPNRKRDRSAFDGNDLASLPLPKSYRPTPSPSPNLPTFDDLDFAIFDDPDLSNLLGQNWQDDYRSNQLYFEELEEKKKQEEEDARLARRLEEQWAQSTSTPTISQPTRSHPSSSSQMSQTYLRPDGALRLPQVTKSEPLVTSATSKSFGQNQYNNPIILDEEDYGDDNDDDLQILSDWNFESNSQLPSRRTLPQSFDFGASSMPGAFPGANGYQPYVSVPGGSVYNSSTYAGSTSFTRPTMSSSSTGLLPSLSQAVRGISGFIGSSYNPVDLDTYRSYNSSQPWAYADPAETQEEIRNLLKQIRPDDELTPDQAAQISPPSLKVTLMPHQLKGLAWMKVMEEGTNKGGILADDMGLGKTIQALALIVERPCPDGNKPTLIVAPVALMEQWAREIKKVVKKDLIVQILHNATARVPWSHIRNADVLLTTYGTLTSELQRKLKWDEKLKMVPDAQPSRAEECPLLGEKSKFWRIILDEAQYIKNRNTKAAAATNRLQSIHRWCLSGTPMQNNVDEMFSLIRFCRIRPYNDYDRFAKDIGRPLKSKVNYQKEKAMQQLQALLKAVLLRRTKKSKIDGKPILQLPEKITVEERAIFGDDELVFYKQLEAQAKIQFNKYLRNGTVGQNYSKALVLLLRLRQCCCSPQLITNTHDFITDSGVEGIDMIANARALSDDVVARLKDSEEVECPACMDAIMNPIIFNPCGHNLCQDCLSKMVDNVMQEASPNISCPYCRAPIDTKMVTDHESFLRVHCPDRPGVMPLEEKDLETESEDSDSEDDEEDDHVYADSDQDEKGNLKDFVVDDDDYDDEDDDLDTPAKLVARPAEPKTLIKTIKSKHNSQRKSKKGKGKDKPNKKDKYKSLAELRKEGLRSKSAKKKYIKRLSKDFVSSTKIEKTLELLHQIHDRGEGEKTIIFSSFTSFLDLLEVPLSQETQLGDYTRYDGSMSAKHRNESVLSFTDKPNNKIILVSIKAGNAGLNLTAANHVIILDPFWNPFVEYQAADRCYRIGQMREVTVHRVLIGEEGAKPNSESDFTVEDRILKLQEKKRELVETALDENAGSSIARLGREELGYLFGVNRMPGQGA